jgi:hypothetical protein
MLTRELLGILTGASRMHEQMETGDWKGVNPP